MCVGGREKMNGDGQELDVAFWAQLHLEQNATSSSRERAQPIARVCAFCVCVWWTHQRHDNRSSRNRKTARTSQPGLHLSAHSRRRKLKDSGQRGRLSACNSTPAAGGRDPMPLKESGRWVWRSSARTERKAFEVLLSTTLDKRFGPTAT